jgi:outer membrane protein OmpA-like peptidoglycan-associated protein
MNWRMPCLAGVLWLAVAHVDEASVEACGIKLTVKTASPKRAVAHSGNPSHVLLLGAHSATLEHELVAAGHSVEVAPNMAGVSGNTYPVVIVDAAHAAEARSRFGRDVVIVSSGDEGTDRRSLERVVARQDARVDRAVVAARLTGAPRAAGPAPDAGHHIIAAQPRGNPVASTDRELSVAQPATAEAQKPAANRPAERPTATVAATIDKPMAADKAEPVRPAVKTESAAFPSTEVYFATGSSKVEAALAVASLSKAARSLAARADSNLIIEGYADPTGTHENNMTLSQARAEAVRDYLVSAGIDASRIEVAAFGDTRLKYSANDSRNRRVTVGTKH